MRDPNRNPHHAQPPSEPTGSEIDGLSNLHTKVANKMPDTFYLVRANGTIGALTLRFPPQTSEDRRKRRAPEGGFRAGNATGPDRTEDLARSESATDWIVFRGTPTVSLILLLRARETRARMGSSITRKIFTSRSHSSRFS